MRYQWRKMLENGYDQDVIEQRRKSNEDREADKKSGLHLKDLGSDYNAFSAHQRYASSTIDRRSLDLRQALSASKLAAKKATDQDVMTAAPHSIVDTSYQNLES